MSTNHFRKDHIDGKQKSKKKKNHVAEFDKADFRTVKAYGDKENKSIPGKKNGQRMFVSKTLTYKQNGTEDVDRNGKACFAVMGVRDDNGNVKPHHLVGKAKKEKEDGKTTKYVVDGKYVAVRTKKTTKS